MPRSLECDRDTEEDEEREQNEEAPAREAEPSVPGYELAAGRLGLGAGRLGALTCRRRREGPYCSRPARGKSSGCRLGLGFG